MPEINWIAVIVASVAAFGLGAIWYSPVMFIKPWMQETGITEESTQSGSMAKTMLGAYALVLVATIVFALFLGPSPGLTFGLGAGFSAGLFWVAAMTGMHYLFEGRSLKLWLINGGYNTAVFTIIGGVLGAFP